MSEVWRSAELGLVMLRIEDDPRKGKITTEVEELHLGEPDPSIFAPPPGYTVREQKPIDARRHHAVISPFSTIRS